MTYDDVARIVRVVDPSASSVGSVLATISHAGTDLTRAIGEAAARGEFARVDEWLDFADSLVSMVSTVIFGGVAPPAAADKVWFALLERLGLAAPSKEDKGDDNGKTE